MGSMCVKIFRSCQFSGLSSWSPWRHRKPFVLVHRGSSSMSQRISQAMSQMAASTLSIDAARGPPQRITPPWLGHHLPLQGCTVFHAGPKSVQHHSVPNLDDRIFWWFTQSDSICFLSSLTGYVLDYSVSIPRRRRPFSSSPSHSQWLPSRG